MLGNAEVFKEEFIHPIELGQKQNATKRELAEARQSKNDIVIHSVCMTSDLNSESELFIVQVFVYQKICLNMATTKKV